MVSTFLSYRPLRSERHLTNAEEIEVLTLFRSTVMTQTHLQESEMCSICREGLDADFAPLSCKHVFHRTCIRAWLVHNTSCPLCRQIQTHSCGHPLMDTFSRNRPPPEIHLPCLPCAPIWKITQQSETAAAVRHLSSSIPNIVEAQQLWRDCYTFNQVVKASDNFSEEADMEKRDIVRRWSSYVTGEGDPCYVVQIIGSVGKLLETYGHALQWQEGEFWNDRSLLWVHTEWLQDLHHALRCISQSKRTFGVEPTSSQCPPWRRGG